jgi:hypothetical protein
MERACGEIPIARARSMIRTPRKRLYVSPARDFVELRNTVCSTTGAESLTSSKSNVTDGASFIAGLLCASPGFVPAAISRAFETPSLSESRRAIRFIAAASRPFFR